MTDVVNADSVFWRRIAYILEPSGPGQRQTSSHRLEIRQERLLPTLIEERRRGGRF
jgi:hypothetical protein